MGKYGTKVSTLLEGKKKKKAEKTYASKCIW